MEHGLLMGVRPRSTRCLGSAALTAVCTLALSSCALASEPSTPGGFSGANGSTSGALNRSGLQQLAGTPRIVFPLTVVRTGGIAGFDDHLVLEANGRVHVDSRTVRGRVCSLTSAQQRLLTLLAISPLSQEPARSAPPAVGGSQPAGADEQSAPVVITVSDERSRPVDLDHSSSGEVHFLLEALLGDVTLSTPSSTRCSTAASAPTQAETSTESVTSHG